MRKLTKKALSLVLCIMLVVSAISCAFSVTAETVGSTTLSNGWVVYDAPVGLELNGDMSTWLGIKSSKGNPRYVSADGVLRAADGMADDNAWEEVGPARFKIPGAVVGTKVKISFDLSTTLENVPEDKLADVENNKERLLWPAFRLYDADGSNYTKQEKDLYYKDAGTIVSQEFTITDPDQFFRILIRSCKGARAAWSISNIKVEATHPEALEDEELIGKTTITTSSGKSRVVYDEPVDLELDGDMSSWVNNDIAKSGAPVYVSENGVLKAADGMAEVNAWEEVGPACFKIPNVEKGSIVQISFDFSTTLENVPEDKLTAVENNTENLLWPAFMLYSADGNSNDKEEFYLRYKDAGTIVSKEFVITDPDQFFRILFRSCKGARAAWAISNIKVTVTPPEEEYVELEFDETDAPSYYGTAEGGFNSTVSSYPVRLKPIDGVPVLDFEAGFIYWSGKNSSAGTLASDSFKLRAEGDNIYLGLYKDGYVNTAQTAYIKVSDLKAGDKVALIYNAKGEDATKLKAYLKQEAFRPIEYGTDGMSTTKNPTDNSKYWNPSSGTTQTIIQSTATLNKFAVQTGAEGWTTYVTDPGTILDPTSSVFNFSSQTADIFLQVVVGKVASAGNDLDAALDDIIIAKVVNGAYYNLATGEKIYDVNDAPADSIPGYYGTEEDGFNSLNTSSFPQNLKPIDGPANLDFSDGFIYWSGRNAGNAPYTGSFASDSFKLVADGENKYITLRDDGFVDTMRTVLIKAEGVAPGDQLAVIYEAKGEDANKLRVTLNQEHLRGNHVSYDPVTGLNTTGNNPSPGTTNILVSNQAPRTALEELPAAAGWTPYATGTTSPVNDPATVNSSIPCTSDIYLQVVIDRAPSVNPGDKLDAAIDNIRIVKIVDEVYYDISTNQPIARVVEHEEPAVNATHLTDLVSAVLAGTAPEELDYNGDGNVDLLDVVFLKKWLADIL